MTLVRVYCTVYVLALLYRCSTQCLCWCTSLLVDIKSFLLWHLYSSWKCRELVLFRRKSSGIWLFMFSIAQYFTFCLYCTCAVTGDVSVDYCHILTSVIFCHVTIRTCMSPNWSSVWLHRWFSQKYHRPHICCRYFQNNYSNTIHGIWLVASNY